MGLLKRRIEYTSANYEKYMSKNKLKQRMIKKMQELIINIIEDEISFCEGKVLDFADVGCGEGFVSDIIKKKYDFLNITGIDYSEAAIEHAKKLCDTINFTTGSIYGLDYSDNSFDIVLCSEVLEHLEQPEKGLLELLRITKKSIILSVPNDPIFRMGNMLALKNIARFGNPTEHIQHWTSNGFLKWIQKYTNCSCYYKSAFTWTIVVIHI